MKINGPFTEKILTAFIREEITKAGFSNGILGLSGGLDSAVIAALAVRALGPDHVTVCIMPYGRSFPDDAEDARKLAGKLKIEMIEINIAPMVDAYFNLNPTTERLLKGNKMARERMSILYDYSVRKRALVLGTSNKTEMLLGYGTVYGDMACALAPIGDLYKTQVRQLAEHLEIPERILGKTPTAGFWMGKTDEQELGLAYTVIDEILFNLVDKRLSGKTLLEKGFDPNHIDKVIRLIKGSQFKRSLPPVAKLSERTVGHDFLYPYDWGK